MARNSNAGRGQVTALSRSFRDMLNDGGTTPSGLLLQGMRGELDMGSEPALTMRERLEVAAKLVQYELPRLAAIEADIQTVGLTHEEWLGVLDDEPAERRTMQ